MFGPPDDGGEPHDARSCGCAACTAKVAEQRRAHDADPWDVDHIDDVKGVVHLRDRNTGARRTRPLAEFMPFAARRVGFLGTHPFPWYLASDGVTVADARGWVVFVFGASVPVPIDGRRAIVALLNAGS